MVALISNTVRPFYDSTAVTNTPYTNSDGEVNAANGGNLFPTGTAGSYASTDVHGIFFEDLTFSIQVHLIIRAIVNHPTYNLNFSDDFFDLTNGPDAYKGLYMLCQRKEGRIFDDTTRGIKIIDTFNGGATDSTSLPNVVVRPSNIIVYNLLSLQSIAVTVTFNFNGSYPDFTARILEGSTEKFREEFAAGSQSSVNFQTFLVNSMTGYTIEVSARGSFNINSTSVRIIDPQTNVHTYQATAVQVTIQQEFVVRNHLPSMSILEFLQALFKMFNLTAFEKDGKITIKTLEEFYTDGVSRNITKFVDPKKITVDKALPYQQINLGFENKTKLAKQHSQLSSSNWGELKFTNSEDLDSNNQVFDLKIPFEHMKFERLIDANTALSELASRTNIQVGWLANESGEPFFEDAVVFQPIYVDLGTTPIRYLTINNDVNGINELSSVFIPSNSVSLSSAISKQNINFGNEINEFTFQNDFTDTLFEKYYKFYLVSLFNTSKRLFKLSAKLPKSFLMNFTLADQIVIEDEKYKINSITTNLLTGRSDMQLLNGQTGPETNHLHIQRCSDNADFEHDQPLSTLNLATNRRVEDSSAVTYKVVGNVTPSTHTQISITDTGLINCPAATPPSDPDEFYTLLRCSDNSTGFRSTQLTTALTLSNSQRVQDSSSNTYINTGTTTDTTITGVSISAVSPAATTCTTQSGIFYYNIRKCGTTDVDLKGFSTSSGELNKVYVYDNSTYKAISTATEGSIDLDQLVETTCPTYNYNFLNCADGTLSSNKGFSLFSNLDGTLVSLSGSVYILQATSATSGYTTDIDTLSTASCPSTPVSPDPEYYTIKHCQTLQFFRSGQTTSEIILTTGDPNGSRVADVNGVLYIATAVTTNPTGSIGAIVEQGVLGCGGTATDPVYYALQKCDDSVTGFIGEQTKEQLSAVGLTFTTGDIVETTTGTPYTVVGETSSGLSVGPITSSSLTQCPTTPPPASEDKTNAIFISCDDPAGALVGVQSNSNIGTNFSIRTSSGQCLRFDTYGTLAPQQDISNFTIFSSGATSGENCIICNNFVPPAPSTPTPPTVAGYTLNVFKDTTEIGICNSTSQKVAYFDGPTLAQSTVVYTNNSYNVLLGTSQYFSDGAGYYAYWNSSTQTLTSIYPTCP